MRQPVAAPKLLGSYLGTLLETHHLSVSNLAEATGLEPDFIVHLLDGSQILTADIAFLLAEVFGGSPLVLLEVQRNSVLEMREQRELQPVAA